MSSPYLSEIRIMAFSFAPKGWALCDGQTMSIQQNAALFALLGTTFGGNGVQTFQLPNLQGRVPLHIGPGYVEGQTAGEANHTLNSSSVRCRRISIFSGPIRRRARPATPTRPGRPAGGKVLGQSTGTGGSPPTPFGVNIYSTGAPNGQLAPQSLSGGGGSQPHENEQPYLVLNFCIALTGIFPSRN